MHKKLPHVVEYGRKQTQGATDTAADAEAGAMHKHQHNEVDGSRRLPEDIKGRVGSR